MELGRCRWQVLDDLIIELQCCGRDFGRQFSDLLLEGLQMTVQNRKINLGQRFLGREGDVKNAEE